MHNHVLRENPGWGDFDVMSQDSPRECTTTTRGMEIHPDGHGNTPCVIGNDAAVRRARARGVMIARVDDRGGDEATPLLRAGTRGRARASDPEERGGEGRDRRGWRGRSARAVACAVVACACVVIVDVRRVLARRDVESRDGAAEKGGAGGDAAPMATSVSLVDDVSLADDERAEDEALRASVRGFGAEHEEFVERLIRLQRHDRRILKRRAQNEIARAEGYARRTASESSMTSATLGGWIDNQAEAMFCWKDSFGRGVGTIPNTCPGNKRSFGAFCYSKCNSFNDAQSSWTEVGADCHQSCNDGDTNAGLLCTMKTSNWKRSRESTKRTKCLTCSCRDDEQSCDGKCYTPCHRFWSGSEQEWPQCNYCFKSCADNGYSSGVPPSCPKKMKLSPGLTTKICPEGKVNDGGLCYPPCGPSYDGVGPVCWGTNPLVRGETWVKCGAGFAKSSIDCAFVTAEQATAVLETIAFFATAGASGAAKMAVSGAEAAATEAAVEALETGTEAAAKQAARKSLAESVKKVGWTEYVKLVMASATTYFDPMSGIYKIAKNKVAQETAKSLAVDAVTKLCKDAVQEVAEDVAQDIVQDVAQDIVQDIAQDVAQDVAQDIAQDVAQDVATSPAARTFLDDALQAASDSMSKVKDRFKDMNSARKSAMSRVKVYRDMSSIVTGSMKLGDDIASKQGPGTITWPWEWAFDSEADELCEAENALLDEAEEAEDPHNSAADYARVALGYASALDPTGISGTVAAFLYEKCSVVTARYATFTEEEDAGDEEDPSYLNPGPYFTLIHGTKMCAPQSGTNEAALHTSAKWALVYGDEARTLATNDAGDAQYAQYVSRALEECSNTPGCRYLNVFPDGRYELLADADCQSFRDPQNVYPSSGYQNFARAYKFTYEYDPLVQSPHAWFEVKKTPGNSHRGKCVGTVVYSSSPAIGSGSVRNSLSLLSNDDFDKRVTDRGRNADSSVRSDALFGELSRRAAFRCLGVPNCNAFNIRRNGMYELLSSCDSVVESTHDRAFQRNFSIASVIEEGFDDFMMLKRSNGGWNTYCTGSDPLYSGPAGSLSQATDLDETQITASSHQNDTLFFEYTKRAVRKCRENNDCGYVTSYTDGRYKLWPKSKPMDDCVAPHGSARTYALRPNLSTLAESVGGFNLTQQVSCSGQPFRVLKNWRLLAGGEPQISAPSWVPKNNALMFLWSQRGAQACADTAGCKYFSVNRTAGMSMYDEGQCDSFVSSSKERVYSMSDKDDELGEAVAGGFFELVKFNGEWSGKCTPSNAFLTLKSSSVGALFSDVERNYTLIDGKVSASPKSRFFASLAERAANECLFHPGCGFFNVYTDGKYALFAKGSCGSSQRGSGAQSRMYRITFDMAKLVKVPNLSFTMLESSGVTAPEANACAESSEPFFSSEPWALLNPLENREEATGSLNDFKFYTFTQTATAICLDDSRCAYVSVKTDASYKMFEAGQCNALTPSPTSRVFQKYITQS